MADILDDVSYLSQEIGPRPAGTEEEQQAALYIADKVHERTGFHAEIEDISCMAYSELVDVIYFAVALVLLALAFFLPVTSIVTFILSAIVAVLYYIERVMQRPILGRVLTRDISQNVVVKYRPGTTSAQAARPRKIVVVANYDSGRVRRDASPRLVGVTTFVARAAAASLIATPLLILLRNIIFAGSLGVLSAVFSLLCVVALVFLAAQLVLLLLRRFSTFNEAANSNASSIAVMLEVLRRIDGTAAPENAPRTREPKPKAGGSKPGADEPVVHGPAAARAAGVVPEDVELVYEEDALEHGGFAGEPAQEPEVQEAAQPEVAQAPVQEDSAAARLRSAKAAIAALTGEEVDDAIFLDLDAKREQAAESATRAASFLDNLEPRESQAEPIAAPTVEAEEPTQEVAPAEAAQGAEGSEGGAEQASEAPASTPVAGGSVPEWYLAAQAKANRPTVSAPVRRSQYAQAFEVAPRQDEPQMPRRTSTLVDEETERRIREMQESFASRGAAYAPAEQAAPQAADIQPQLDILEPVQPEPAAEPAAEDLEATAAFPPVGGKGETVEFKPELEMEEALEADVAEIPVETVEAVGPQDEVVEIDDYEEVIEVPLELIEEDDEYDGYVDEDAEDPYAAEAYGEDGEYGDDYDEDASRGRFGGLKEGAGGLFSRLRNAIMPSDEDVAPDRDEADRIDRGEYGDEEPAEPVGRRSRPYRPVDEDAFEEEEEAPVDSLEPQMPLQEDAYQQEEDSYEDDQEEAGAGYDEEYYEEEPSRFEALRDRMSGAFSRITSRIAPPPDYDEQEYAYEEDGYDPYEAQGVIAEDEEGAFEEDYGSETSDGFQQDVPSGPEGFADADSEEPVEDEDSFGYAALAEEDEAPVAPAPLSWEEPQPMEDVQPQEPPVEEYEPDMAAGEFEPEPVAEDYGREPVGEPEPPAEPAVEAGVELPAEPEAELVAEELAAEEPAEPEVEEDFAAAAEADYEEGLEPEPEPVIEPEVAWEQPAETPGAAPYDFEVEREAQDGEAEEESGYAEDEYDAEDGYDAEGEYEEEPERGGFLGRLSGFWNRIVGRDDEAYEDDDEGEGAYDEALEEPAPVEASPAVEAPDAPAAPAASGDLVYQTAYAPTRVTRTTYTAVAPSADEAPAEPEAAEAFEPVEAGPSEPVGGESPLEAPAAFEVDVEPAEPEPYEVEHDEPEPTEPEPTEPEPYEVEPLEIEPLDLEPLEIEELEPLGQDPDAAAPAFVDEPLPLVDEPAPVEDEPLGFEDVSEEDESLEPLEPEFDGPEAEPVEDLSAEEIEPVGEGDVLPVAEAQVEAVPADLDMAYQQVVGQPMGDERDIPAVIPVVAPAASQAKPANPRVGLRNRVKAAVSAWDEPPKPTETVPFNPVSPDMTAPISALDDGEDVAPVEDFAEELPLVATEFPELGLDADEGSLGGTIAMPPIDVSQLRGGTEDVIDEVAFEEVADAELPEPSPEQRVQLPEIPMQVKQSAPLAQPQAQDAGAAARSRLSATIPTIDVERDEPEPAPEPKPWETEAAPSRTERMRRLRADLPSMSGRITSMPMAPENNLVSTTGSFGAVSATGNIDPVGDELVADVPAEEIYVDDADDSLYNEVGVAEAGAYISSDYVKMPEKRRGLFGRRKRREPDEVSPQQWLGVADDFDAREIGKARGDWTSFRENDERASLGDRREEGDVRMNGGWRADRNNPDPVSDYDTGLDSAFNDDEDDFLDEDYGMNNGRWNGGAFSGRRSGTGGRTTERDRYDAYDEFYDYGGYGPSGADEYLEFAEYADENYDENAFLSELEYEESNASQERGGRLRNLTSRFSRKDKAVESEAEEAPLDDYQEPAYDYEPQGDYSYHSRLSEDDAWNVAAARAAARSAVANVIDDPRVQEELGDTYGFVDDAVTNEVWFVALGAGGSNNAGMEAFLDEHGDELRGAMIINLEGLGDGELVGMASEGVLKTYKPTTRMKRFLRNAGQATGVRVGQAKMNWRDSAATVAMRRGIPTITVAGVDGDVPVRFASSDDVADKLDESTLKQRVNFILELLRTI